MRVSSLSHHLADLHEIYQQQVVVEELLNERQGVVYHVGEGRAGLLCCPFPHCLGKLANGWMMRRHFRDVHPLDNVDLPKEGRYPHCPRCGMQVNPRYPAHINTKESKIGTARQHQQDMAVRSALALQKQFTMNGVVLEKVEVFQYLSHQLLQDDDDIQAVQSQLCKARGMWVQVGQVPHKENAPLQVSVKFYKAIVQSVLLYGSKTCDLSKAVGWFSS
jgi:hypothetical protein